MNVVLWIIAIVLAIAFVGAGLMKMLQPKEKLIETGLGWTEGFSPNAVKAIGALDFLAGLGLVLPALFGVAEILVPLAAVGIVLLMIGAIVVHGRRRETPMVIANLVLLVLAAVVAWGRF
ncbi:DoxX-like family protein [Asanoa hainanensis]|uniref:DoxX-like family protein n=1 Tax=Asanoa hainanensis TaxID=560556 RepID=A0A239I038_9ACTN|nr:DoxX family protein [Asanoa hainanensis]SNS86752.1 DoxX-like family protein [Asanoa hainanensis]